jgi:uncharacterized damage-inducible protein DinB
VSRVARDHPSATPGELVGRLQSALAGILAEADRVHPEDAYARPAADAWSAAEILAHLVEMLPYWAEQARAVAARGRDGEPFGRTHDDPERIAAVREHARDDLGELAAGVRASLDRATAVLRAIPDPGWQRTGRHARRGEMSVVQIVEQFLVEHAGEHAQQLAAVLARPRHTGRA